MSAEATPTRLYVGRREHVLAETGAADCYSGKYLVVPLGDVDFIQDGCRTLKELREQVAHRQKQWPTAKVVWL